MTVLRTPLAVFDLEFTAWECSMAGHWLKPGEFKEVVQIGAVKLDPDFQIIDELDILVKPRINSALSPYFENLTGIGNARLAMLGVDFAEAYRLGALISGAESMAEHRDVLAASKEGFSDAYLQRMAYGADMKASELARAYRDLAGFAEAARSGLGPYQGLLLPVTPAPAFTFEEGQPSDIALYTSLANIVGLPAISAPVGLSETGLPLAIQALAWDDETALGLGKALADYPGAPPSYRG